MFGGAGGFEVEYFPSKGKALSEIRGTIQEFIRWHGKSETKSLTKLGALKDTPTTLLYLRGHIEEIEDGEAWLVLGNEVRLSRSWLRQELRRSLKAQQIIILDCPEATSLDSWIEDLQSDADHGQCLIAAASTAEEPELFSQTLLKTLVAANPRVGLSVAKWVAELQRLLLAKGINLHVWLSGTQTVIDILPGNISTVFQELPEPEDSNVEENKQFDNLKLSKEINNFLPSPQPSPQFWELKPSAASPAPLSSRQSSQEVPASPPARESSNNVQPQLNLVVDSQQHTKLEQLLTRSIGPIAPTILQTALIQAANCQELVDNLATYVLPERQQQFEQQAMALLESSTVLPQSKSVNSPSETYEVIDANFISKCERELAYSVGPIASFITQQVLKCQPQISLPEFVKKLATKIREPKQALEFEQRMLVDSSETHPHK